MSQMRWPRNHQRVGPVRDRRTRQSAPILLMKLRRLAGRGSPSLIDQLDNVPLFGIPITGIRQQELNGQIRESSQVSLNHATTGLPPSDGATLSKDAAYDRLARTEAFVGSNLLWKK